MVKALSTGGALYLRQLSLAGNRIGDKGIQALAVALQCNHKSRCDEDVCLCRCGFCGSHLELTVNRIGDAGAIALAKTPNRNTSGLRCLSLGRNRIGNAGAKALANALSSSECKSALDCLDLDHNRVAYSGAYALAGILCNEKSTLNNIGGLFGNRLRRGRKGRLGQEGDDCRILRVIT